MNVGSKEHYEIMDMFERDHQGLRLDKEPKESWARGVIYQNGDANNLFLAYRNGYGFGKCIGRMTEPLENIEQLPKLTAEVFDHPDCPAWATAAVVSSCGTGYWVDGDFETGHKEIPGQFDFSNWKNSQINRPAKLPEWCKVGEWVWNSRNGFGKIVEIVQEARGAMPKVEFQGGCGPQRVSELKPARVRPWTFEEAPKAVKVIIGGVKQMIYLCSEVSGGPSCNYYAMNDRDLLNCEWLAKNATQLNGKPCGTLEVVK